MNDWTFVSKFGAGVAKRAGVSSERVWESMIGPTTPDPDGEHEYKFTEEDKANFSEKLWQWTQENSGQVAILTACIAAARITISAVPAAVRLLGFGPLGPVAGALAPAVQAVTGPIVAGGAFAVLQSAGMGGMGLIAVKAIAASGAMVPTCSLAAVSFLNAMGERTCGREEGKGKGDKKEQGEKNEESEKEDQ